MSSFYGGLTGGINRTARTISSINTLSDGFLTISNGNIEGAQYLDLQDLDVDNTANIHNLIAANITVGTIDAVLVETGNLKINQSFVSSNNTLLFNTMSTNLNCSKINTSRLLSGSINTHHVGTDTLTTRRMNATENLLIPKYPPSSSSAIGSAGQLTFDNDFLYICVAPNTWKRVYLNMF